MWPRIWDTTIVGGRENRRAEDNKWDTTVSTTGCKDHQTSPPISTRKQFRLWCTALSAGRWGLPFTRYGTRYGSWPFEKKNWEEQSKIYPEKINILVKRTQMWNTAAGSTKIAEPVISYFIKFRWPFFLFKITCQEKICRKLNICTSIPGTWYIVFVRIPRANAKTLGEIVLAVHSTRTPNQLLPCTLLLYCCCCCCFTPARALDALRLLPPCTLLCCAMKHTDIGGLQYPGSLRMVCHCCRRVGWGPTG